MRVGTNAFLALGTSWTKQKEKLIKQYCNDISHSSVCAWNHTVTGLWCLHPQSALKQTRTYSELKDTTLFPIWLFPKPSKHFNTCSFGVVNTG